MALNIDADNNALDFEIAKSVGEYFRLDEKQMGKILKEVVEAVHGWEEIAEQIGISRAERELMQGAFRV